MPHTKREKGGTNAEKHQLQSHRNYLDNIKESLQIWREKELSMLLKEFKTHIDVGKVSFE
jgi:wobble nucleotide-excising tRNase